MPRGRAVAALMVFVALGVFVPRAGYAAPACRGATGPSGQTISETPWPQTRFGLDRLAGLSTGAGVTVAVLDSGIDAAHPQLSNAVVGGLDVLDGSDSLTDCAGHGTAVASVIAARPAARSPLRGVAPGARILSVRVSERQDVEGTGPTGATANPAQLGTAIRFAVDKGASVLNLSLVMYRDEPPVRSAIAYAVSRDVLVVAAAGNEQQRGGRTPYPAGYPDVLGVGAVGPDGVRIPESQVGSFVDLAAPGADVIGAARGGGLLAHRGTSFAAPFVAGAAALVRAYYPSMSAEQVAERLRATADPAPGGAAEYGAGIVNPYRAVTSVRGAIAQPNQVRVRAGPDPQAARDAAQLARTRTRALWLAAGGLLAAAIVVLAATVLPRGARRRWRPAGRPV